MQKNPTGKLIYFLTLLVWTLVSVSAAAQTTKDLDTRLQNGRVLLDQKKYELAMAELLPVFSANLNYKNTPQALYLYSVAAVQTKKYREAGERLNQLQAQFPNWPNLNEARYLSANVAFEQKDYTKAIETLSAITDAAFAPDKNTMKLSYLARITSKAQLSGLVQKFPDDAAIAQVYADKLIGGWYTEKDKATLENLVARHDLDKKKYSPKALGPVKKGQYNVAVLLPFPTSTSPAEVRKNKLATDLYSGIEMARDSLAKQNIAINLFSYEAPADTNRLKSLLTLPELATMDMIIGPLYKSGSKLVSRFANQNQIVAINPLSEDISLVKNNPYIYLYRASTATQARRAAEYAYDTFSPKTAVIVYSNTLEGMEYARVYKATFEKRGGKVLSSKGVSPTGSAGGIYSDVNIGSAGHIMIASNHNGVAYTTMSALERLSTKIPVITYPSWLEMSQFSLKQLDDQEIYFLYPNYVDTSLPHVQAFRRQYTKRYKVPPYIDPRHANTGLAFTGFDLLYYFGNILNRHGSRFGAALDNEGTISGVFYQGIGYGTEHDNQYVPIVKLDELQLNVVNPVFK